ncbi:MAG TPA: ACP S-malonyltransferase [Acidimicrobiales bacterium]|nr:ACP S-malonyltransferase [Acidimicrobiales bacterium]
MLALLFAGQGSQRPGMGAPWRDHPSWAVVDRLAEATGIDLGGLLLDADAETLRQTRHAQPATFAVSLVALDAARRAGLDLGSVVTVAGHSLGEYTALVAAGALGQAEAARLVAERGEAMQAASDEQPGTMAAVLGLEPSLVATACEGVAGAWMANDNAPGQIVVAGTPDGVERASEAARQLGAKRVLPLPVGGAFHSPLMHPAQARLDRALQAVAFTEAAVPVVANVDASPHQDGFPGLLSAQLTAPVRWRESLLAMAELGATSFLELGPGAELSGMVRRAVAGATRANVAAPDDLDGLDGVLS